MARHFRTIPLTAFSRSLFLSLPRAILALAVLAGLLLGMAQPPSPPQTSAGLAQTATLELGGGTFGPSGHVLAEDFRQIQQRLTENAPASDGDAIFQRAVTAPAAPQPVPERLSAANLYRPASQTPDRHRPTGPPRLLS